MTTANRVKGNHGSNAIFNTLFLAFSFAVIAGVAGKNKIAEMMVEQVNQANKTEEVYEHEYALHHNTSKAIYQYKI